MREVDKNMPSHLGIFNLSHCETIMNKFVHEIGGCYSNKVYYQDTDSLNIPRHKKKKSSWSCWKFFRTMKKQFW